MEHRTLSNTELEKVQSFLTHNKGNRIFHYYLIPMIGIDMREFEGARNVESVHINKEGTLVYVNVNSYPHYMSKRIECNDNYKFSVTIKDTFFIVFKVPDLKLVEFQLLIQGRYTEFQASTKKDICKLSGLPYNMKLRSSNLSSTHLYLQALFSDSSMREVLSVYLNTPLTRFPKEILSKLKDDSTVYIENFIKQ